jgi:hypothetical protein
MPQPVQQIHVRLDPAIIEAIDSRCELVGLSRNAWLAKVTDWALAQPVRVRTVETKERI